MFSRKTQVISENRRTLGVFLSEGSGFGLWKKIGSFEREMAIYFELARNNWKIRVFSYDKKDQNEKLPENVSVSAIPFGFLNNRFLLLRQLLLPFLLWFAGRKCDVLITNQAHNGGWIAAISGKLWGAAVIARCGYVYGEYIEKEGVKGLRHTLRSQLEKWTMKHSDRCFIPTNDLLRWVTERYKINKSLIHLIPNFVDTDLFKPDIQKKCEFDIICIGRLSPEKRHKLILEAVEKLSFKKVLFIGSGPLKNDLIITGSKLNVNIQVIDKVSNSELPAYINSSKYFILASTWEGHPKSLIEAMSCGCICIGADRPGINNMVRHNETGILFNSTSAGLREAIINISNNLELSNKIQQNARNFILENMSFKKISSDYKTVLYHL